MKKTYTTRYRKQIKRLLCMILVPVLLAGVIPCLAFAEGDGAETAPDFTEDAEKAGDSVEPEEGEEDEDPAEPEEEDEDPAEPGDGTEDPAEPGEETEDPAEPGEDAAPTPTANEPVYTDGSATSVTVTGAYSLNGCDYLDVWLEKSTIGADADFERIDGTNDGTGSVTFHESDTLAPNTTYWYRTSIETNDGTDTSEVSSFTTLPRVDTVDITQMEPDEELSGAIPPESPAVPETSPLGSADISGSIPLGSEDVSDVIITWSEDAAFTQNVQMVNGSSGVTFTNAAYTANVTDLTAGEEYSVKVEAVGPGGMSEPAVSSFVAAIPMLSVPVGTDGIIVETEAEFRSALGNVLYTTIYLGVDITMSSGVETVADRPLVINGTDPRAGGTRHSYTDYSANTQATVSIRGAGTDITFKDIDVYINNRYGIYYSTSNGETVAFDGVTGQSGSFFYGYGSASTLVIKDSVLTLNTTNGNTRDLVRNAGKVCFEGDVTVKRTAVTADEIYFFYLIGESTVEVADNANVTLDNNINTLGTNRTVFYGVDNLTIGDGAAFACYSGKAFCTTITAQVLTNVTIGRSADVRFIHTGLNHLYNSLYGTTSSTFTMEPGSSFLIYDNESDGAWGALYFSRIQLKSPDRFIVMNADSYAVGYSAAGSSCTLEATGIKSMRYYQKPAISGLFDLNSYIYTPTSAHIKWWIQQTPFMVTISRWPAQGSAPTVATSYSATDVPVGATGAETTLIAGNAGLAVYGGGNQTRGVEIYGSFYTVTYNGNGADSGTDPGYSSHAYNETLTVPGAGGLARTSYAFNGWNTAANGSGFAYSAGDTIAVTEDITLYAQWTQTSYTVSGTLSGGSAGGLAVSYTINGGSVQTVTADSNGYYAITEVPGNAAVVITPPAQTDYTVDPLSITVNSIRMDSTGNDFTYTKSSYTVTEKYVDESTGMAIQSDTFATLAPPSLPYSYSYSGSLDNITLDGAVYIYQGYKAGSYSPGNTPDGTSTPTISALTADETVYLIYHKVNSTISVTFPTGGGWDFYVSQDTYPNVETGAMGDSRGYYAFKNESDKPVYVDLTEVRELSSDGLNLVADAATSTPGSNEYSLQLLPAPVALTGAVNGFATTISGIMPGTYTTMRLGALDGRSVQQATPTSTNGYVTIGGYYAGYLSAAEKNPQLALTFTFSLVAE